MRVTQEWIDILTLKQQTVLLSALRGCDGVAKHDISKKFVRKFRSTILINAENTNNAEFMKDEVTDEDIYTFTKQPDTYHFHWLMHFIHAVEIIGYNHPNKEISEWWKSFYYKLSDMLHMNPETKEQNNKRLIDCETKRCWKT